MLVKIADLGNDPKKTLPLFELAKTISTKYEDLLGSPDYGGSTFTVDIKESKTRRPGIHASEASGCLRRAVYTLQGTEKREEISSIWRRRFNVGHAVHAMIQADLHKLCERIKGWQFHDEVVIHPGLGGPSQKWNVHSSCDGIFTIEAGGTPMNWLPPSIVRVGLEIKTISPSGYKSLKSPLDYHLDQAHVYMACLDLPLMWFLYFNKGNQSFTASRGAFLISFDPDRWAKLEERFASAHKYVEVAGLPPRDEGITCQFCPYTWTCKPSWGRKDEDKPLVWKSIRAPVSKETP